MVAPLLIAVAHPTTDCAPESSGTVSFPPLVKLGASLTDVTFTATVAVFESIVASFALKVKLVAPLKFADGVNATLAVQVFAVVVQSTAPMGPSAPFEGAPTIANVRLSSSASVAVRVTLTGVSSKVDTALPPVWPCATGVALGGNTTMSNMTVALASSPPLAVPPSSVRYTDTDAVPVVPDAGVYTRSPVDSEMSGCTEKSELLSFETLNVSTWPDSLAGPFEMLVAKAATVCAAESSITAWSGAAGRSKLGASFTAVTVIMNVCAALVSTPPLAVPPLSDTLNVIVAVPFALAAGVYVSTPFEAIDGEPENNPGFVLPVTVNATV